MRTVRFRKLIWSYYRKQGRHDLPWRSPSLPLSHKASEGQRKLRKNKVILNPYCIFVSEVMLQQTQVSRVLKKYPQFLKSFPNWKSLANAPVPKLLRVWQGMGYNRRVLQLKRAARMVMKEYGGKLPKDPDVIDELPGIGKATAASIAVFAFNSPAVFIETNIRRVFIHHFFPNQTSVSSPHIPSLIRANKRIANDAVISDKGILSLVEKTLDMKNSREWYWALMDYGSALAKSVPNPNRRSVHYAKQSKFKGSRREVRGKILKTLLERRSASLKDLTDARSASLHDIEEILSELMHEGFVSRKRRRYELFKK